MGWNIGTCSARGATDAVIVRETPEEILKAAKANLPCLA
jgi:hypothetical protein